MVKIILKMITMTIVIIFIIICNNNYNGVYSTKGGYIV